MGGVESQREMEGSFLQWLLSKFIRNCYAVVCLGVVIASVPVARYLYDVRNEEEEGEGPQERTKRRLSALHGPSLRTRSRSFSSPPL